MSVAVAPESSSLASYTELERQIADADEREQEARRAAILRRWQFGRMLLAERGGAGRLPNGRLAEICEAVGRGKTEINDRVRLAERYRTEAELSDASEKYLTWRALVRSLDKPKPRKPPPPEIVQRHRRIRAELQRYNRIRTLLSKGGGRSRKRRRREVYVPPMEKVSGVVADLSLEGRIDFAVNLVAALLRYAPAEAETRRRITEVLAKREPTSP